MRIILATAPPLGLEYTSRCWAHVGIVLVSRYLKIPLVPYHWNRIGMTLAFSSPTLPRICRANAVIARPHVC